MKKFFPLFVLIIFLSAHSANSCDCTNDEPFLNTATGSKLIALVRVVKHQNWADMYRTKTPLSMQVEIIEVLKGSERRKNIEIFGNNGNLCRPYVLQFKEGTEWILALNQGEETNLQQKDDYYISNCGIHWLSVNSGKISGVIRSGNTPERPGIMQLREIKKILTEEK